MAYREVEQENVLRALKAIVDDFETGFYGPLTKRHSLCVDEAIPISAKKNIDSHGTCACTDGNHVYFDTNNCAKMINEAREKLSKEHKYFVSGSDPYWDVETILAHEYTHILMEHVKRGYKFVKKYGKKNYGTFALACDIEANRGYKVQCDSSAVFKIGVTDESFPEVKGVTGLMNIYNALLKKHGDDIDNEYDKAKKDKNGEGEDDDSSEPQSENSQQAQSNSENKNSNSLTQEQKDLIRSSVEDFDELEDKIENYDDGDDSEGEESEGGGIGNDKDDDDDDDIDGGYGDAYPKDVLKEHYSSDMRKQTKIVMKNLRNIISGGNQIKEKVKTYSRPARRDGEDGLMRKGTKYAKVKAPKILIGMDSSGSMRQTTMQKVADSIGTIVDELGRDKNGSWICEHDDYVNHLSPLSDWKKVVSGYIAGGGNDFNALLKTAIDKGVDVVLNIGDGCDYITRKDYIEQANEKGITWYDISISNSVNEAYVTRTYYDQLDKDNPYHFERKYLQIEL